MVLSVGTIVRVNEFTQVSPWTVYVNDDMRRLVGQVGVVVCSNQKTRLYGVAHKFGASDSVVSWAYHEEWLDTVSVSALASVFRVSLRIPRELIPCILQLPLFSKLTTRHNPQKLVDCGLCCWIEED